MLEIESILRKIGIREWTKIHYIILGLYLKSGLKLLWVDKGNKNMLKFLPPIKQIHIYVEHVETMNIVEQGVNVFTSKGENLSLEKSINDDIKVCT